MLSKKLSAEIIHTDDFASWENPMDWWIMTIEKVFEPIAGGAKVLNYKRSSWAVFHKSKSAVNQPVTKIMIIEGVGASRKEFDKYIGLSIFVDTPKDVCLKRGMERDNGQYHNDALKMKWREWNKTEEEHFTKDDTKNRALIIVDGTNNFKIKNNKIKQ